jgi:hypothetical protein
MTKAKICKTTEGKYVVKVRFLFFWWRAVEVEVLVVHPDNKTIVPEYKIKFVPELNALHFSSEYGASFFLEEVNSILK